MSNLSKLESLIKKNKINQIQICYLDYSGRLCGKIIPIDKIRSIILKGVVFAKSNLSFGLDDHFANDAKFLANSGDFLANPDASSFTILSHRPGIARFYSYMMDDDDKNWLGCPRFQLKKIIQEYKKLNLDIKLSLEPEFSVYTKNENYFKPYSFDGMFTISGIDKFNSIWQKIYLSLKAANIKIEQIGKEFGPGQYEATWTYSDVIQSIDNYLNFKDIVKSICNEHNLYATFMPKPYDNLPGNGLHLHLSLWKNNKEISCSKNDTYPLSDIGSSFVAGLLQHAHSLTATGCASVNSYKRILPGTWSPAHICWGNNNRSALVRIPGKGNRKHIELRHGDNNNNPYIYLITVLAAGLAGIKNKLKLEDPITEDVGIYSNLNQKNIKFLPRSFNESLTFLKNNKLFKKYLGDTIYNEFIKIKETELRQYEVTVHQWERDKYFELF